MPRSKPLNKILKISFLALAGTLLGVGGAFFVGTPLSKKPLIQRSIAGVGGVRPRLAFGKQAAALEVVLSGPEITPEGKEETVELVATITQHIESDGGVISYKWALPPGVELVRGPLNSTMSEISLGQPRQVTILVKGFSREKQKLVSLSCQLQKAGQELTASGVIVSRPEDTAEAQMMDLGAQAKADEEAAAEASTVTK
jgi:hypothetical protein